jgi:hypothetical protein
MLATLALSGAILAGIFFLYRQEPPTADRVDPVNDAGVVTLPLIEALDMPLYPKNVDGGDVTRAKAPGRSFGFPPYAPGESPVQRITNP